MSVNFFTISKFLLYLAPFAVIVVTSSTLFPFIVGKYTYFKVIIELAVVAAVLGWGFDRNFKFGILNFKLLLKNPLFIAVTFFVGIFTIAGFTGVNPWASFWSNFERGEGSFLLLHFYAFFSLLLLLFQSHDDWRTLFKVSLGAGVLVMVYGIMGALGVAGFVDSPICSRFAGSLGNPAYIGTYTIFALFYAAYLLVSGSWGSGFWRQWSLPFLVFLLVYFSVFLLLSQTRGALFGLGVGAIVFLLYLALSLPQAKWRKAAFIVAVVLVAVGSLGIYYRQHVNLAPWCAGGGNRILDISFKGETINTRFVLWQQSIDAWKERPILGWGPENFSIAFEKHFNPVHTVWFDRAHNIFFDYLVFSGALGLLSFIGMFIVYYWQFFSSRNRAKSDAKLRENSYQNKKYHSESAVRSSQLALQQGLILALPVAYLVQGLVLFDVLPIYINLFLVLAFAAYALRPHDAHQK